VTEAELQKRITDLCDWLALKWHHETDSRKSKKGFPDLVICGVRGIIFAELKSERGRVTIEQDEWLLALLNSNAQQVYVRLWRPSGWDAIEEELKYLAGRTSSSPFTL